jgi:hypothetical protein
VTPERPLPRETLPDPVRLFVIDCLDSVAELEGLLLVRASRAQRWSATTLADRLYITDDQARRVLEALHRRAFMSRTGEAFEYAPASETLRRDVDALAAAYPRFLIAITDVIHAKPHTTPLAAGHAGREGERGR